MPENINHGVSLWLPPLALHGGPPAALRYIALAPRGPRHGHRRGRRGTAERHSAALPADVAAQESGAHIVRLQRVSWCGKFDKKPQIVSNSRVNKWYQIAGSILIYSWLLWLFWFLVGFSILIWFNYCVNDSPMKLQRQCFGRCNEVGKTIQIHTGPTKEIHPDFYGDEESPTLDGCDAWALVRYRQETLILERSAEVHGYSFQAVGLGQPFTGVGSLASNRWWLVVIWVLDGCWGSLPIAYDVVRQ